MAPSEGGKGGTGRQWLDAQAAPALQRHHIGGYHAGQTLQADPRWHHGSDVVVPTDKEVLLSGTGAEPADEGNDAPTLLPPLPACSTVPLQWDANGYFPSSQRHSNADYRIDNMERDLVSLIRHYFSQHPERHLRPSLVIQSFFELDFHDEPACIPKPCSDWKPQLDSEEVRTGVWIACDDDMLPSNHWCVSEKVGSTLAVIMVANIQ